MTKRIVIMAGGTGGHVFPALAVAETLIENGWQVSWLGTHKGLESRVIPERGIEIDWLAVAGVRGKGLFSKVSAVGKLMQACVQATRILRQRQPDVVLGMGGFVAGPGGAMAKLMGIPLVIHEQNRIPGTTNRLLASHATRVLEAFPNSFKPSVKATCTGNPLRKAFLTTTAKKHRDDARIKLLIIGGSQGAQILNEIVPLAVANLADLQIKHQTGSAMQEQVAEHYRQLGIDADVNAFFADMVGIYQWADVIIARAGAMTVSEVSALGLAAIFIPLPTAIDDHQTANARYLSDHNASILLPQKDLTAQSLATAIQQAVQQQSELSQAAKQLARLNATEVVASICSEVAGQ